MNKNKKPLSTAQLAGMYCTQKDFQEWGKFNNKEEAADYVRGYCKIKSRSELNINLQAAMKFKELLEQFEDWKFEKQHSDNINRI